MARFLKLTATDETVLRVNEDRIYSYYRSGKSDVTVVELSVEDADASKAAWLVTETPEQIDDMVEVLVWVDGGDVIEKYPHLEPRAKSDGK